MKITVNQLRRIIKEEIENKSITQAFLDLGTEKLEIAKDLPGSAKFPQISYEEFYSKLTPEQQLQVTNKGLEAFNLQNDNGYVMSLD